jgi:hypothetical protein
MSTLIKQEFIELKLKELYFKVEELRDSLQLKTFTEVELHDIVNKYHDLLEEINKLEQQL